MFQNLFVMQKSTDFKNTVNYSPWYVSFEPSDPSNFPAWCKYLVSCAVLAGNSHNSQPWKFYADSDKKVLEVHLDNDAVLSVSDPSERQAVISCGCAIGNIEVASQAAGWKALITFLPSDNQYLLAMITFEKDTPRDTHLFKAIPTRRVNRAKCDTHKQLPAELERVLASHNRHDLTLSIITDAITKNTIAEIQEQAVRFVIGNPAFRTELGEWLIPNDSQSPFGMPGNTFGLRDQESVQIHTQLLEGSIDYDLASGVAIGDRDRVRTSSALVALFGANTRVNWIRAGMSWQRVALEVEAQGISMAVSAAIVEVPLLARLFSVRCRTALPPLVICTIGYATEGRPHSPRKTALDVLSFSN